MQTSMDESVFIGLATGLVERDKKGYCLEALNNICEKRKNVRVYNLLQSNLKEIKSYPFIYWISNAFRKKFSSSDIDSVLDAKQGLATSDNNRFLRFWWEVNPLTISKIPNDGLKWVRYVKGGNFNKWFGNNFENIFRKTGHIFYMQQFCRKE